MWKSPPRVPIIMWLRLLKSQPYPLPRRCWERWYYAPTLVPWPRCQYWSMYLLTYLRQRCAGTGRVMATTDSGPILAPHKTLTSWHWNPFRTSVERNPLVTDGFSPQRASNTWLWLLLFLLLLTCREELSVILDAMTPMWRHYNIWHISRMVRGPGCFQWVTWCTYVHKSCKAFAVHC